MKIIKYVGLVVLLLSLCLSVYCWMDTAVSLDHSRQQQKAERETRQLLSQFILSANRGMKRSEVLGILRKNSTKDTIIKEDHDRILADDVVFRFDANQSLAAIESLSEGGE